LRERKNYAISKARILVLRPFAHPAWTRYVKKTPASVNACCLILLSWWRCKKLEAIKYT